MVEIYRNLLVIICICLLGWGIIRLERIYQYPFFMASIFISFLIPQVFALIANPGPVSTQGVERVLLMSCLCAAACWVGYERKPNKRWLAKLNIPLNENKLFRAGVFLMAQGYFFKFMLSRTPIQRSSINGNWTGPATIYLFFSQVIYIAFSIFLLQSLKKPKFINILFTVIAGIPLVQTILEGRRQPTMTFLVIIGLSLWLVHRLILPRWLFVIATLVLTVIIPVIGRLRSRFWDFAFSGRWEEILYFAQEQWTTLQEGDILELRNAALLMDAVAQTNLYSYGTGFWDAIVFQYIPGQIVGFDFKQSLQFRFVTNDLLISLYNYSIPIGTTPTGVGDSYLEFGYLGCITFALIGYIFKNLWISSFYYQSTIARLLYMGLISPAMVGITHGIGRFIQEALFQLIFIFLVAYYSKTKNP